MTDKVLVESDTGSVFAEYLGIPKRIAASGVRFYETSLEERRAIAVACALELIKTKTATGGVNVQFELNSLSDYADRIESALIR
ncbi:hypothetical protein ACK377_01460 [Aeromonas veronii]